MLGEQLPAGLVLPSGAARSASIFWRIPGSQTVVTPVRRSLRIPSLTVSRRLLSLHRRSHPLQAPVPNVPPSDQSRLTARIATRYFRVGGAGQ